MDTLSDAIRRLQAEGYTGNWFANADRVLSATSPATCSTRRRRRSTTSCASRAQSDPGDMTILFALRTPAGSKGLYSTAFGAEMPAEDAAVIALHAAPQRRRDDRQLSTREEPT